jgi:hypothetical protein
MSSIRDGIFHCGRCGTVKDGGNVYVPKLVERCREFQKRFDEPVCTPERDYSDWNRLGVRESINLPENR